MKKLGIVIALIVAVIVGLLLNWLFPVPKLQPIIRTPQYEEGEQYRPDTSCPGECKG